MFFLLENIFGLKWLQQIERVDLSKVYFEVITFIKADQQAAEEQFYRYTDRVRFAIAKYIFDSDAISNDTILLFLRDKNFLIRNLVVHHFEKLTELQVEQLLSDKAAKVRLSALQKLSSRPDYNGLLIIFLADRSASLREFARYELRNSSIEFSAIYSQNLIHKRQITGSLYGLAEVNAKQHTDQVIRFLNKKIIHIRKVAFVVLQKLNETAAYDYALENMDNESAGIRNAVIDFLAKRETDDVLEKARSIFKNGRPAIRLSMIKFFNKVGGWSAIAGLLIGTTDNDENVRKLALTYVETWRAKARRLFTKPSVLEKERINEAYQMSLKAYTDNNSYRNSPLAGLDIFLDQFRN
jgi:hypothetical protein